IFVQIHTERLIQQLCQKQYGMSEKEVLHVLTSSDYYHYEKGLIDSQTFYQRVKRELNGDFSFGFFKRVWQEIFTPVQPMIDLLPQLKLRYQLVLLSNTNELHMVYIESHFPFFHFFNHIVYSYQVGMSKPDKEIFHYTLNKISSRVEECVFIDDTDENVESAEELGIQSFRFIPPKYLQRIHERASHNSIENVFLGDQKPERYFDLG
ncbi:HAD-IA family hydrolase, partial [bacterium]|nr:HAD-IA family hydrolase [bacterium]